MAIPGPVDSASYWGASPRWLTAHATDCQECGDRSGQVDHVTRQLLLSGPLSESQRQDLLRIADRCPVHRTLENHPVITTTLIRD